MTDKNLSYYIEEMRAMEMRIRDMLYYLSFTLVGNKLFHVNFTDYPSLNLNPLVDSIFMLIHLPLPYILSEFPFDKKYHSILE